MAKALVIRANGESQVIDFTIGESYEPLKTAVNGWLECVHLPSFGADLWLNEEGKLIGLQPNQLATWLWEADYGHTDFIVGDIVLTGGADEEGETLGLSDDQLAAIRNYLEL